MGRTSDTFPAISDARAVSALVNANAMKAPRNDDGSVRIERILPNVTPTIRLER